MPSKTEEYALWVELANDPSQSAEARQHYRVLLEAHVHEKLREAFRAAAAVPAADVKR